MKARLGNIRFEGLKSPSDFTRTSGAEYAEHALFGRKPKIQRTGQALDTIELSIQFHANYCNPSSEIRSVKRAIIDGSILPFTLDNGETIGRFVITSFVETWRKTFDDGTLLSASGSISLKEVALEISPVDIVRQQVQAEAFAVSLNNPETSIIDNTSLVDGGGGEALEKVKESNSLSQKINNFAKKAQKVIAEQEKFFKDAQQTAQKIEDNINEARAIITAGQTAIKNAERALDTLESARDKAIALQNASSLSDITTAVSAASDLTSAMQIANLGCAGLASQVTTRQYP